MLIPALPADSSISDTNPNGPAAIFHLTDQPSNHVFVFQAMFTIG